MKNSTSRSESRVPVVIGRLARGSEEARAFLQERLAVFGKVVFILVFCSLVFAAVLALSAPASGWRKDWSNLQQYHVLASALPGIVWLICRRGTIGLRTLHFIDWASLILICALFALVGVTSSYPRPMVFTLLLAVSNVMVARAVAVPSSARRTLLVSGIAMVPVLLAIGFMVRKIPNIGLAGGVIEVGGALAWVIVAVSIASVGSRVIFGLRREMRKVMRLGQYTLLHQIGEGGMGVVYKAKHALLRRPTAIKLLPPDKAGEDSLRRFEREVQLTSMLTHPNTIAIYDYGRTPEGVFYYAMEYLEGLSLQELVSRYGPLPPARVIHILRQVCAALTEAHGAGLIHRDIKPANILLCERGGVPDVSKVLDFGLVKELQGNSSLGGALTQAESVTGTPLYLPPEAINKPNEVDARSDLYALGGVGFFLVSGKPMFEGVNVVEICSHHLHTAPPTPSSKLGAKVPADLEALLLRCLEKDPQKRPQDAAALGNELSACTAAGEWTTQLASEWWAAHKAADNKGEARKPAKASSPKSVVVDMDERDGSLEDTVMGTRTPP